VVRRLAAAWPLKTIIQPDNPKPDGQPSGFLLSGFLRAAAAAMAQGRIPQGSNNGGEARGRHRLSGAALPEVTLWPNRRDGWIF
jgi:hypothetical protein